MSNYLTKEKTLNMNCNSKKYYDWEQPHTLMQLSLFKGRLLALENSLYNGVYSSPILLYEIVKGDLETLVKHNSVDKTSQNSENRCMSKFIQKNMQFENSQSCH